MKLISCLMPSMRSPEIVERAIRSYLAQTYPCKELVIVTSDTATANAATDLADPEYGHLAVFVHHVPVGLSIGELRNVACRLARGSVLASFDDDDISHPDRLTRSMACIDAGADLVGSSRVTYVDPATGKRYLFDGADFEPLYMLGGTLTYRRKLWEKYGFEDVATGEDTRFLARVCGNGHIVTDLADESLYTATISPDATSKKDVTGPGWKEIVE